MFAKNARPTGQSLYPSFQEKYPDVNEQKASTATCLYLLYDRFFNKTAIYYSQSSSL